MTNPRSWFAATTLLVGLLAPSMADAAALPVKIEGFEGEVVQVSGATHSGVTPGKGLQSGTQVKTGRDGRADLSLNGAPTLRLGNDVDLLVHSMDQDVLRLRTASGALYVDTRTPATAGGKSRDVRLNAGDLRLRIANAQAWIEVNERTGQVCVLAGVVEAQQPSAAAVRLDTPGQCLRQSGQSAQWTMVPIDLLQARVAATGMQRAVVAAAAPPKPQLQIKVLPLPGTLPDAASASPSETSPAPTPTPAPQKPPVVVLQQAPVTSTVQLKGVEPLEAPAVPELPEPLPVAPAAAATLALKLPEPADVPVVPDPPEPLPVAPAPATTVALKPAEPVEVPVVPDPPAPLPVAPAATGTVAVKLAEPVEPPEIPEVPQVAVPVASVPSKPKPVPLLPEPSADVVAVKPAEAVPVAVLASPPVAAEPAVSTEVAVASPASDSSAPTADDGRRWRVVLGSMPEKEKAELEAERLNARGWAVEPREYRVGDRHGFRIGFGEFATREDAQRALEEFLVQYPDAPAWLAKY